MPLIDLSEYLLLPRCPHCSVDTPNIIRLYRFDTVDFKGKNPRAWGCYSCSRCGGVIIASSHRDGSFIKECYPDVPAISSDLPERPREYLSQAVNSLHAPAGAVMLAAGAVDAMLKEKGYKDGTLYKRIEAAARDHLITDGMKEWAHKVRLGANEQRHSDEDATFPSVEEARHLIEFATALGQFLFVLPAMVQRGVEDVSDD